MAPLSPSTATPSLASAVDQLWVEPWLDHPGQPGRHEARSPYVERFWLSVLGPTSLWLLRLIATDLERSPRGTSLDLAAVSAAMGLGYRSGRNAPIARSLDRLVLFAIAKHDGMTFCLRTHLPDLTPNQLRRLPPYLRRAHVAIEAGHVDPASPDRGARRIALTLAELGDTPAAIVTALEGWKIDQRAAERSVQWAAARLSGHPSAAT